MGMEGDTIITQDLFLYDMIGERNANHRPHRSTGTDGHVLGSRAILRRREAARAALTPPKSPEGLKGQ